MSLFLTKPLGIKAFSSPEHFQSFLFWNQHRASVFTVRQLVVLFPTHRWHIALVFKHYQHCYWFISEVAIKTTSKEC